MHVRGKCICSVENHTYTNIELRVNYVSIGFCFENWMKCSRSLKMINVAYAEASVSKTTLYIYTGAFKNASDIAQKSKINS